MKRLSLMTCALLAIGITSSTAQSSVQQINYKEQARLALTLPLTHKTEISEQTILSKLKETGYTPQTKGKLFWKNNKQDGFYIFPGVQLPELANQKLDLYFKVDPRNGDSAYNSSISLMVSKGYDNFVTPESDPATFAATENFLNSFVTETATFNITKEMDMQRKKITEAEKKGQQLRDQQDNARKKIAQLESDIKNWQQEETAQQQEINTQKSLLQNMETKRTAIQ